MRTILDEAIGLMLVAVSVVFEMALAVAVCALAAAPFVVTVWIARSIFNN